MRSGPFPSRGCEVLFHGGQLCETAGEGGHGLKELGLRLQGRRVDVARRTIRGVEERKAPFGLAELGLRPVEGRQERGDAGGEGVGCERFVEPVDLGFFRAQAVTAGQKPRAFLKAGGELGRLLRRNGSLAGSLRRERGLFFR